MGSFDIYIYTCTSIIHITIFGSKMLFKHMTCPQISMYGPFCVPLCFLDALVHNGGSKIFIWGVRTRSLGYEDFHVDFDGGPTIFIGFFEVDLRFLYMFWKHTVPVWRMRPHPHACTWVYPLLMLIFKGKKKESSKTTFLWVVWYDLSSY